MAAHQACPWPYPLGSCARPVLTVRRVHFVKTSQFRVILILDFNHVAHLTRQEYIDVAIVRIYIQTER